MKITNTRRVRGTAAQRGFSLIVSLMMLIVIIILGISASQMAINEERGARNDRDRQIAFQAAEAALKDAEYEILNPASPPCAAPGQVNHGRSRVGFTALTCFNSDSGIGFGASAPAPCSVLPNAGLCPLALDLPAAPAWLDPQLNFLADAKGTGTMSTVAYGQYTGRAYGSQATFPGKPLSKYPPRYIIELVRQNTSSDSLTSEHTACGGLPCMFRITAMGFGANPNTQVVLQTIVATKD